MAPADRQIALATLTSAMVLLHYLFLIAPPSRSIIAATLPKSNRAVACVGHLLALTQGQGLKHCRKQDATTITAIALGMPFDIRQLLK